MAVITGRTRGGLLAATLLLSMLVGCAAAPPATSTALPTATVAAPTATPQPPTPTPPPSPTPTPTATVAEATSTPPATTPTANALPAEPQRSTFQAADGESREGLFFPAAQAGAPVVVLLHWARGNECDWAAIAPWLQNRGQSWECPAVNAGPWLDPQWFPPLPADTSYNVFVFSYRGCDAGGCKQFDPEGWLADAHGALQAASRLPGVDAQRVVAIGASIGADGAADACQLLNEDGGATCRGALSLSPGSYLGVPYADVVAALDAAGWPAWCLYDPQDSEAKTACEAANGTHYRREGYAGGGHGMLLLQPALEPAPLQLLLDFVATTVG